MSALPDWLEVGTSVRLPGGPPWKIVKVDGGEVSLTPQGDDHPVVWGLDKFLACWVPVRLSRFERDEPL